MSSGGAPSRGGRAVLLAGLSLYAAVLATLLRLPCRVPGGAGTLPTLCATAIAPADQAASAPGGFLTGGPSGDRPALIGMLTTVLGWCADRLAAPLGAGGSSGVLGDLSVALLALVWIAVVGVVAALSGRRVVDAAVLALAPVVVLVGFTTWELWAVLFMLLALLFHVRGRPVPAGVVLGLGASVALFPLVVLLAVLLLGVRHRQFRDVLVLLAGTVLTWVLLNGPYMIAAGERWRAQFAAMLRHPLEGSSLWSLWGRTGRTGQAGPGPDPAGTGEHVLLALALGFVVVLVITLLARREPSVVQVALLLLAVFVLLGPGYSPVQALWLAPLVVLGRRNRVEFAVWQLVEVLYWTTLVLPQEAWPVLPGPHWWDVQDLLAAVRLLFLAYFVVVVAVDTFRGRRAALTGGGEPG